MRLSKKLTTVTPFSKYLALSLFVILPILAFLYGKSYQYTVDQGMQPTVVTTQVTHHVLSSKMPTSSNSPFPTGIPLAHNGYFTIDQWHLRAPYNGPLALEYSPSPKSEQSLIFVSSAQLNADGPSICTTAEGAAGTINRYLSTGMVAPGETAQQFLSQNFNSSNSTPPIYTKVGNYYYIYDMGQADNCNNATFYEQTQKAFENIVPQLASY
jgi:hypothetical protein